MNKAEVVLIRDNVAWDDLSYLHPKEDPEQAESWAAPARLMTYEGFRLLRCEVVRSVCKSIEDGTIVQEEFMTEADALRAEHAAAIEEVRAHTKAKVLSEAIAVLVALRAEAFDRYSTGNAPSGTNVEWDTLGDAATALLELYPPDMKREG